MATYPAAINRVGSCPGVALALPFSTASFSQNQNKLSAAQARAMKAETLLVWVELAIRSGIRACPARKPTTNSPAMSIQPPTQPPTAISSAPIMNRIQRAHFAGGRNVMGIRMKSHTVRRARALRWAEVGCARRRVFLAIVDGGPAQSADGWFVTGRCATSYRIR